MNEPVKSRLFAMDGTSAGPPALVGGRCACGYVFFPMQTYGCEKCGRHGDALTMAYLPGRGTLQAFSQVHLHARPHPKVPFTVLSIALDDGPLIRALLEPPVDPDLRGGAPMVATIVRQRHEGRDIATLRFKRANDGVG